jgi:hypothetical protein
MTESERERLTPTPTGDSRVDAVIQGLSSIEDMDLAERPAVLETVHSQLRELLGELGETGPAVGPGQRGQQGELGRTALRSSSPGPDSPGAAFPRPGSSRPAAPQPGSWRPRPGT